jgi:DNA-binding winged helix-turn-helix (wHTH) protein/tetratricopeptide (TPR) repeat protein
VAHTDLQIEVPCEPSLLGADVLHFAGLSLNLQTHELWRGDALLPLAPQSMAVLAYLLRHRGRVVSRDELLREVWGGVHVAGGSLRQAVFELRQALEDRAEAPAVVQTIRGRGYRFVAQVDTSALGPGAAMPTDCTLALAAVAVWGRASSVAELGALLRTSMTDTLGLLDACLKRNLLVASSALRVRFAEEQTLAAVYAGLAPSLRAELHHRAAIYLAADSAMDDARLEELARHSFHGAALGSAREAVSAAQECAERATLQGDHGRAKAHFERALEAQELVMPRAPATTLALEIGLVESMRALGQRGDALDERCRALAERARTLAEPVLTARAVLALCGQLRTDFVATRLAPDFDPREVAALEEALSALPEGEHTLHVLLRCALSFALTDSPERPRAEALLIEALTRSHACECPQVRARPLLLQLYLYASPQGRDARTAAADALTSLAEQHGLRGLAGEGRIVRATDFLSQGDGHAFTAEAERVDALARLQGTEQARSRALVLWLYRAYMQGNLHDFERIALTCYRADAENVNQRAIFLGRMSSLALLRQGVTSEAVAVFASVQRNTPAVVSARVALVAAYAELGQLQEAAHHLALLSRNGFADIPQGMHWFADMSLLAEAVVNLGDTANAERLYALLLPYADQIFFYGGESLPGLPISYHLADLCTSLGRCDEAETLFERAEAMSRQVEAPLFLQYCALGRTRLHLRRGGVGESARASRLLARVAQFASERGLGLLLQRVQKLEAGHAPVGPASTRPQRLHATARTSRV